MFNKKIFISIFCGLFIFSSNVKALNNSNINYSLRIYKYATQKNIIEFKNASNKHGIDIMDINGDTALCHAINNNDPKTYKFLIKEGAKSKKYCMQKVKKSKLRTFEKTLYAYENNYSETLKSGGLLPPVSGVYNDRGLSLSAKTGIALGTVALIGGGVAAASGGGGGGSDTSSGSNNTNGNDSENEECEAKGGTIINGHCIMLNIPGYNPKNDNPNDYHTTEYNSNGIDFLTQINADVAYARGYTGYIVNRDENGNLINTETGLISDKKVKVGIYDTSFDINHPDLYDNIVKNEQGKTYGYTFDFGPCRGNDKKNCFAFNVTNEDTQRGNIVFYNENSEVAATGCIGCHIDKFNEIFELYPDDYDWDKIKNNPDYYLTDIENADFFSNTNNGDHGTHIMGIIGGTLNNEGMHGVAPNVDMVVISHKQAMFLLDEYSVDVKAAQAFVDENIRVVNMSFGLDLSETPYANLDKASTLKTLDISKFNEVTNKVHLYETLADNNIVIVQAAGNDGNNKEADILNGLPLNSNFKAGSEHDLTNLFITVVAVKSDNTLTHYSQKCGETKNYCLAAPGGDTYDGSPYLSSTNGMIYSTVKNDEKHKSGYGYMQGTSMATPVVTGSVALLMGAYPHLSSQQIVEILFRTATDIGQSGVDEIYGNGLINLDRATSPIEYLAFDFSNTQNQAKYTSSALILSNSTSDKIMKVLPDKFVAFDEYDRSFEIKTSSIFADTSKQKRHLFENDFKSFMSNSVQNIKMNNNLSLSFNNSIAGNDIYSPYGFLKLTYKNNKSDFYAFYSDNTVLNNFNTYNNTAKNPFISMDNAFGTGFNYKLDEIAFNFDYISGKNNFFEDENNSDLYDNNMDIFSTGLNYNITDKFKIASNIGILREDGSVLGMIGKDAFNMHKTNTFFTGLRISYNPIKNLNFTASYYRGYTNTSVNNSVFNISDLISDSIAINANYNLTSDNIIGLDIYSPLGIKKGTADIYLASGRHPTEDKVYLHKYQVDLKDNKREWNISMFYDTKIKEDTNFKTRFGVRINPEHQENAKPDYFGMFNFSFSF